MATAGYSGTPLPKKLGIKEGTQFTTVHAPDTFDATLGTLPAEAVRRARLTPGLDVVVAFYTSRGQLGEEWAQLTVSTTPNGAIWVAWPKKASRVTTDITEDVVREVVLPSGWVDNKVCAIDDTWSGLRFALRRELR
jgi:hypothetical protein